MPKAMASRRYPTFEAAARRVEYLRKQPKLGGPWPGITGPSASGWYSLTYDPAAESDES